MRNSLKGVLAVLAVALVALATVPAASIAASPEIRNSQWSNMCLDADPSQALNGKVYLWECYGGKPQSWSAIDVGSGDYAIRSNLDDRCLDADPEDNRNGGYVRRWDCNGYPAQRWRFDQGKIYNVGTGRCLDADSQAPNAGQNRAPVQMWDCLGLPNARWKPDPLVFCGPGSKLPACQAPATKPPAVDNACNPSPRVRGLRLRVHGRPGSGKRKSGGRRGRNVVKTRYGRPARLKGRLTRRGGGGVPNARVCVRSKVDLAGAVARDRGTVLTDNRGRFSYKAAKGPSRIFSFVHRAAAGAATARVKVRVPAPLSLQVPRRFDTRQGKLTFRGRLRGQPRRPGTMVVLQSRRPKRWQTFATARLKHRGRFVYRYRFSRFEGVADFKFRALMPAQSGSPFARGTSRVKRVRVTRR